MRRPNHAQNERGQASIMIGMMMMTFILFFAFVINTGMLVNAKINLQNAADLAAFSGASVQARTLNQISYLNYEMRRQYKKFLFRYYVMGNMAQDEFPRDGGSGPAKWKPNHDDPKDYSVPAVCMIFNAKDNFCHLVSLPKIKIPGTNYLDAINDTLIDQLKKIEAIRQGNCASIGSTNVMVLRLWLWNTDPDLAKIQTSGLSVPAQRTVNTIRGLARGMGLIPRELILRQRIKTLNGYVNQAPIKTVTLDKVEKMKASTDPAATERTIQAFYSAFYTLGNHTFSAGDIVMDELTPSAQLVLKDIKAQFDTYAIDMNIEKAGGGDVAADCTAAVTADIIQEEIPLGVYKDPTVMTYYAIKVKAKAKIMFSPFGDLELKAYAAAQPFGSRIGPALTPDAFVREGKISVPPATGSDTLHFTDHVPNLAIREGDSAAPGHGWDTRGALAAYYAQFKPPGFNAAPGKQPDIDDAAIERAYQAAMAPNPYEINQYNIINDIGADPFVRNFDTKQQAAFWAPIFPPDKKEDAKAAIHSLIEGLMGEAGKESDKFKQSVQQGLEEYFAKLHQGAGEDGEGFNIVRLQDPINTREANPHPIALGEGIGIDLNHFKTSWNGVLNKDFRAQGRVGYSVKFVSFDSLSLNKLKTNDKDNWTNGMELDADAEADLPFVRH